MNKPTTKGSIIGRLINLATIGTTIFLAGKGIYEMGAYNQRKMIESKINHSVPKLEANQRMTEYQILTDLDKDGRWDVCSTYKSRFGHVGLSSLTYRKGYGPSQFVPQEIKVNFAEDGVFRFNQNNLEREMDVERE